MCRYEASVNFELLALAYDGEIGEAVVSEVCSRSLFEVVHDVIFIVESCGLTAVMIVLVLQLGL